MVREIVGIVLIAVVYFFCVVVIFGPTIYVLWLYVIGRKVAGKARGLLRLTYLTFFINLVVAYFLVKLAFECFLTTKVAEWQNLTTSTILSAVSAEERFFKSQGKYYAVGPVRGPFSDQHGLSVEKDVILEIAPSWDTHLKRETFRAYAVHVLTKRLVQSNKDGKVEHPSAESTEARRVTSRLLNSVK